MSNVEYRTTGATLRTPLSIGYLLARVLPAIAFTLDMYRRNGEPFGINEALLASALAAMVFPLLSCQPLTIIGVTGLIALFNYTIYDIIEMYDPSIYPAFTAWVGIWAAIFHCIVSFGNYCDYRAYVTNFSSKWFGIYVGVIYCVSDFESGYLSIVIAMLFFVSVYGLGKIGDSSVWKPWTSGPLLTVLSTMPAAVFAGVFFVVGWGSIKSNGILAKFWYLNSEKRFVDPKNPLNAVPRRTIWQYIDLQALGVACTVAISQTIAAIGFPILIIALISLRTFLMLKWFTEHDYSALDALTASELRVMLNKAMVTI
ncbi:hypothetical protein BU25DRAFT_467405 [Macroventuria anomochaeta]|uniref:Uncharacterized protein n=1 Tax=Macroventuria anomochaeta TaxID=301207 RepID=A0ACB6S3Z9_9PLEO|nr:uncharacterized protein BU25DRAFT_467405 [Macroventuria anomochaeta]KAF2628088.1 hypothetical protein BU25DRAFT_467405 [Macroventuria anomochaeta]